MLEPVVATIVAWAWLDETLDTGAARRRRCRARGDHPRADRALSARGATRSMSARSSASFSPRSSSRSPRSMRASSCPDERRQLERVERLRHVVDAADVEAARAVAELRARGQEDDRDLVRALVLEQILGDPPAVEAGHHHVEEHTSGRCCARLLEPARAVGRLEHRHALGLEVHAAEKPDRRLVVDHQHLRHLDLSHGRSYTLPGVASRLLRSRSAASGSSNANVEPSPSRESTQILAAHRGDETARDEKPEPGAAGADARLGVGAAIELAEDLLLIRRRDSDPSSATLTSTVSRLRSAPTVTVPPAGEYLTALSSRIENLAELVGIRHRRERPGGSVERRSVCPFVPASCAIRTAWPTTSRTSVGARLTCRSPVSRRATLSSASTIPVRRCDSDAM